MTKNKNHSKQVEHVIVDTCTEYGEIVPEKVNNLSVIL